MNMTPLEERQVNFRYAELLRFIAMRENGGYYLPEDMPSLDALIQERRTIDALFEV